MPLRPWSTATRQRRDGATHELCSVSCSPTGAAMARLGGRATLSKRRWNSSRHAGEAGTRQRIFAVIKYTQGWSGTSAAHRRTEPGGRLRSDFWPVGGLDGAQDTHPTLLQEEGADQTQTLVDCRSASTVWDCEPQAASRASRTPTKWASHLFSVVPVGNLLGWCDVENAAMPLARLLWRRRWAEASQRWPGRADQAEELERTDGCERQEVSSVRGPQFRQRRYGPMVCWERPPARCTTSCRCFPDAIHPR